MRTGTRLTLAGLLIAGTLAGVAVANAEGQPDPDHALPASDRAPKAVLVDAASTETPTVTVPIDESPIQPPPIQSPASGSPELPFGGTHIYPGRTLVAYYGTAGTGALGVLGERSIPRMTQRLRQAARPFARPGRPAQIVYELIVTVADGVPGPDGDYSHDIGRDKVRTFIRAAHRNKALLVLDIQPGRSSFPTVVKRWGWALRDPYVSVALDPEWRMGPRQIPAHVIGHTSAREINRVGWWLDRLTRTNHLPDKLLMIHQFRTQMVRNIQDVVDRPRLAEVQHVDGFGTQSQKLATYHHVEQAPQFRMGFKLFYDEDIHRMSAAQVLDMRPRVRFVSFQ